MANIVIVTNAVIYAYHTEVSNTIAAYLCEQQHTISILDINSEPYDYQCLSKIKELEPDVLITLDLAGFRFRTQAGEITFNMLPTKNLNLIWGNKPEYACFLNKKLSLSMLFYDISGINHHLTETYPNLLYYKDFASLDCFPQIWSNFAKETLLTL